MNSPATTVEPDTSREVTAALRATYAAFFFAGFAFATWVSRIPQLRDLLGLGSAQLGWVLLAGAVGALVALPLSGVIVDKLGARRTVARASLLLAVALVAVAAGAAWEVLGVAVVVVGLLMLGFANGSWDVAMNVQGARVERRLGRSVMPRLHAAFSLGTVGGALCGAAMVALSVSVAAHLVAVAVIVALVVPRQVRAFLPEDRDREDREDAAEATYDDEPADRTFWTSWREPRTLLVGLVVLTFALAEGIGNDWIGVALIDGHDTASAVGALGFAVFVTAMTTGRWFGPGLLDRYGRVAVIRACVGLSLAGLAVFVMSPWVGLAFVGLALWGLGASLGFPVGMSAAADEADHAASRVSVVASIGYCAFLAGPPVIGMLGAHVTVLRALAVLAVPLLLSLLVLPALRPPRGTQAV
jgi:predicted MFS family arabinose efflux permease